MTQIQLGEKDRQRWDLPEWMPIHPFDTTIADLTELSDRFSFEVDDWPDVLFGDIPFEQAGQPDAKRVRPKWALQAWVWMALHQNGHPVTWDEAATVQSGWIRMRADDDVEPGKDDESTPSESSDPSTTTPSETSST